MTGTNNAKIALLVEGYPRLGFDTYSKMIAEGAHGLCITRLHPRYVKEKFGVPPSQVVDVLSLMGDSVDNVKGVPGIGEKGARDLITTWGSLDALLEHAAEVPQKKYREALLAHAAEARHSREMVTIHTSVPVEFDIDSFR